MGEVLYVFSLTIKYLVPDILALGKEKQTMSR